MIRLKVWRRQRELIQAGDGNAHKIPAPPEAGERETGYLIS